MTSDFVRNFLFIFAGVTAVLFGFAAYHQVKDAKKNLDDQRKLDQEINDAKDEIRRKPLADLVDWFNKRRSGK